MTKTSGVGLIVIGVISVIYGINLKNISLIGMGISSICCGISYIENGKLRDEIERERIKVRERDKHIEKQQEVIRRLMRGGI